MSTQETLSVTRIAEPGRWLRGIPTGVGILAAGGLVAVLVTDFINFGAHLGVDALNADLTSSWSHNVVRTILVAATLVSFVGAWRPRGHTVTWLVVGTILAFLAVDEISNLHIQVDSLTWGKLLYAPLLAILGLGLWRLAEGTDQRRVVGVGLLALAASFVTHVLAPHVITALGLSGSGWAFTIKGALKQSTELAGWVLMISALGKLSGIIQGHAAGLRRDRGLTEVPEEGLEPPTLGL